MGIDPLALTLLLLPVAALSGWLSARKRYHKPVDRSATNEYILGMNYLLSDQPDKALDVLIRMAGIDQGSVELYLSLGTLFRRRGEVDKAIKVHQLLIDNASLLAPVKQQATYELANDYLLAGVLDRAENLFKKALNYPAQKRDALLHLIQIYERELDWVRAIETSRTLARDFHLNLNASISHYNCEMAQKSLNQGDYRQVQQHLRNALRTDKKSIRALLFLGRVQFERGRYRKAIKSFNQVINLDARFITEMAVMVRESYTRLKDTRGAIQFVEKVKIGLSDKLLVAPVQSKSKQFNLSELQGLLDRLTTDRSPKLAKLYELLVNTDSMSLQPSGQALLESILAVIWRMLEDCYHYHCQSCGFEGRSIHWQCPGCQAWGTIAPTLEGVAAVLQPPSMREL